MNHPKLRKELLLAISFSLVYLFLRIFTYHLDKFLPGIRFDLISRVFFVLLLGLFGSQVYQIFRRRKKSRGRIKLKFVFYLPSLIILVALLYSFIPSSFNSEKLESPLVIQGCYEEGTTRGFIHFRQDKTFEIKMKTETDNVEWFYGNYQQKKDTLFLLYIDKQPYKFGSIILNTGQSLVTVDALHRMENYIQFQVGSCN